MSRVATLTSITPAPPGGILQPGSTYTFQFNGTNFPPLSAVMYLPIFQGSPPDPYVPPPRSPPPLLDIQSQSISVLNQATFIVTIPNNFAGSYWIPDLGSRNWASPVPRLSWNVTNKDINVACYLEGTNILCVMNDTETYIPIENIKVGTLVKTLYHGNVPVKYNAHMTIYSKKDNKITKDNLYVLKKEKYTELIEDLYITGGHSILVKDLTLKQKSDTLYVWNNLEMIDDKFKLLTFLNDNAEICDDGVYVVYHLVLEGNQAYCIYANGLLSETMSEKYLFENTNMKINGQSDNFSFFVQ
jgi:hypothetical protein